MPPLPPLGGALFGAFRLGAPFIAPAFAINDYHTRVNQGQSQLQAAGHAGINFALATAVPWQLYLAGALGPQAVEAGANATFRHVTHVRGLGTPFSHRFEHTEVTARAQMAGMQAIGSAWGHPGMGSEAAAFAARYGRR